MDQKWQKLSRSLHRKKNRYQERCFLVEGSKAVVEVLQSDWEVEAVFFTESFAQAQQALLSGSSVPHKQLTTAKLLQKSGTLVTNEQALAIVRMRETAALPPPEGLLLCLDNLRDPGNLGTIIRLADWYGLTQVVCSQGCADLYNPKTIAATMGAFLRVTVAYTDLCKYLQQQQRQGMEIFGGFLEGENLHRAQLGLPAILVMGSEAKGISAPVQALIKRRLYIPGRGKAESLNAAMATAIITDAFFREAYSE